MREIYKSGVTPQQKLVAVNNKFGNSGIQSQQGTSRILYDTIQGATGKKTFRFFEDSASRNFPFTNTGSEGNKLGVGDTMVVAQIIISQWELDADTGVWTFVGNLATDAELGLVSVEIANNKVIKKVTLSEANPAYNKDTNGIVNTLDLETQIVIPPLLNFVVEFEFYNEFESTTYLQCQIIGTGGIIAPRTTF
jgi:hypothetical protein